MSAAERAAIEQRLGGFAEMTAEDVASWFEEKEAVRVAAARATCDRRGAHIYLWSSNECLTCGEPYEE